MESLSDMAFFNGNVSAFSRPDTENNCAAVGLTKREYFAAAAMQGILANPKSDEFDQIRVARKALIQADALLIELEK